MLANRIRSLLPSIISSSQSAFIPGWLITDNVLVLYELHHFIKTKHRGGNCLMYIKLDMCKAFDRVEWNFLIRVMHVLGFDAQFLSLIHKCIPSVSFSFILNGAQVGSIFPQSGIKQGEPLSAYLFIICGEAFSCLLEESSHCA